MSNRTLSRTLPASGAGIGPVLAGIGPVVLLLLSLTIWLSSLLGINYAEMNDLGLVSVLPASVFVSLVMLTGSFLWSLWQRATTPLLAAHVVVLVVMLYGITALTQEAPRFNTTYNHAGFTEYIMRTGGSATWLDARFSWPGFFAMSAFFTSVAGFEDVLAFAAWSSLFFNLLYLGPLLMLFTAATDDRRLVWLGIFIFYITNWVGQDYFAPQALNYFFYMVVIAILLRWFNSESAGWPWLAARVQGQGRFANLARRALGWLAAPNLANAEVSPRQRAALMGLLLAVFAAAVSSHQLTPNYIFLAVALLVVFNRTVPRVLPVIMAAMLAFWAAYMASDFFSGHLHSLLDDFGQVRTNVTQNVVGRVKGSPEHTFVIFMRMGMAVMLWSLALFGIFRRLRQGRIDLTFLLLAAAPLPMVALQSYGGEVMLRIFFLHLPFIAFFAAALFIPAMERRISWRAMAVTGAACLVLLTGFQFTRYGNERMDYVTYAELDGLNYLYDVAPAGSRFISGSWNVPWRYRNIEQYTYEPIVGDLEIQDIANLRALLAEGNYENNFVVMTRTMKAHGELFRGKPLGWGEQVEAQLLAADDFHLVYDNGETRIFRYTAAASAATP